MFAQCAPRRRGRGSEKGHGIISGDPEYADATVTWRFVRKCTEDGGVWDPIGRVLGGTRSGAGYQSTGTAYRLWLTQASIPKI